MLKFVIFQKSCLFQKDMCGWGGGGGWGIAMSDDRSSGGSCCVVAEKPKLKKSVAVSLSKDEGTDKRCTT